jgi:threonine dehydratase
MKPHTHHAAQTFAAGAKPGVERMKQQTFEWIERCVLRIMQLDQNIGDAEAFDLARNIGGFERTAAMAPEVAVDFVASELARPAPRFERRSESRI